MSVATGWWMCEVARMGCECLTTGGQWFHNSEEGAVPESTCSCPAFLMEAEQTVCFPGWVESVAMRLDFFWTRVVSTESRSGRCQLTVLCATWVEYFLSCPVQLKYRASILCHGVLSVMAL